MRDSRVEVKTIDGMVVATLLDKKLINPECIEALGEILFPLVSASESKCTLDFARVEVVSSTFLGLVIRLRKKARDKNGRLTVVNVHPDILNLMKSLHLEKILEG